MIQKNNRVHAAWFISKTQTRDKHKINENTWPHTAKVEELTNLQNFNSY